MPVQTETVPQSQAHLPGCPLIINERAINPYPDLAAADVVRYVCIELETAVQDRRKSDPIRRSGAAPEQLCHPARPRKWKRDEIFNSVVFYNQRHWLTQLATRPRT